MTVPQKGDAWRWCLALLAFFAAIAFWLVPVLYLGLTSDNPEHRLYLDNILFKQTAERYANPWHHHEPFWYFAEIIALFWMPFSLAFFWLLKPWREAFKTGDLEVVFPLVWGVLIVVFFSISSGKRDMYILPALPAFALAAAPFLQGIVQRSGFRRLLLGFVLMLGAVLSGIGIAALSGKAGFADKLIIERGLGVEVQWLWWMLLSCGAVFLATGLWAGTRRVLAATAISLAVLWIGYGLIAHPVLDGSSSASDLMTRARERAGPDTEIGLVAWKEQNLLQARGKIVEFGFLQPPRVQLAHGIAWLRQSPQTRRLMIDQLPDFDCIEFGGPGTQSLENANRRAWWLVDDGALAGCDISAPPVPAPAR